MIDEASRKEKLLKEDAIGSVGTERFTPLCTGMRFLVSGARGERAHRHENPGQVMEETEDG